MRIGIRFALSAFVLLLSLCSAVSAKSKPVLVISTSAVEKMFGDFEYLTEALGYAEYGQMGTMMAGQYLEGVDKTRPVGFVISTDGEEFQPLGLIPVSDKAGFLESLEDQFGEPEDAGDGVLELAGPVPVYLKEKSGWMFIAQSTDDLKDLAADPMQLLDGLNKKYDLAMHAFVQNIPEEYREMALEQMKEGIETQLENIADDEDADEQQEAIEQAMKQWEAMAEGIHDLTMGMDIDPQNRRLLVEGITIAVDGTKIARQMAAFQDTSTRFAGFILDQAAVTMNASTTLLEEDLAATLEMLGDQDEKLDELIDESDEIADGETKEAVKKLAHSLMDVMKETMKSGKMDMGGSLIVRENKMTWISGMAIASGDKLESAVKELAQNAESRPEAPRFELGVDQHAGVRFHKVSLPIPEEEEDAREVLGDSLDLFIGIAQESAYVGVGENAIEMLRKAIDGSNSEKQVKPFMQVSLTPIAQCFSKIKSDDDALSAVTAALEQFGNDKILVQSEAVEKGAKYRFEIHEGVLRAIGEGIRAGPGRDDDRVRVLVRWQNPDAAIPSIAAFFLASRCLP